jgi:CRISPR-associated protein Csx17
MTEQLQALRFDGIRPDSLGNYLVGLGLLSALSTNSDWRGMRGCWRDGCFVITASEITREQVESHLLDNWKPTPYSRWWAEKQKADTKSKTDQNIWRARSAETISNVRLLDSHIVGVRRNQFNPVLGTGGNIGKRDLARVCETACDLKKKSDRAKLSGWLKATLYGEFDLPLPELNSAGTWFVYANKTFNSGQAWYREGQMSPWSFLLAMEGALMLVGGAARRLSANARSYAVFPFVSDSPSPQSENEVGLVRAEFWAPLWQHPASLPEVRSLMERGLARIGQRIAKAPHEFAIAARSAGVDAGVSEFVRFVLRHTTSSQVYEAVPGERIKVGSVRSGESELIEQIISWLDRLPGDNRQKGKFYGLRGPVENAIIRIAEQPDDAERWQRLMLLVAEVQSRIDRNKELRDRCRAVNWLNTKWFGRAWPSPPTEIQIACAMVSITTPEKWRANASSQSGTDTNSVDASGAMPQLVNIFGVELSKNRTPLFSGEGRPQRAIWHNGETVRLLADVLERRLIDTDAISPLPLAARRFCSTAAISAFLSGAVDVEMIGRWIPALSLIRWSEDQTFTEQRQRDEFNDVADETFLSQALFRPLFYPQQLWINEKELFPGRLRPRAAIARRLLNLIRQGELSEAVQLAQCRYLAAGHSIVLPPSNLSVDHERIAASLLIPMKPSDVVAGLRRWLQPSKNSTER